MVKNSIMIDIDDPRADKIAEAISNKTSKKILGLLSEGENSGSEIAKNLGIPLNTASYNLKKLYDAGLVEKAKKVFWSSKGKRMEIYKLSNKQIVISPRKMVRGVMPALIVSVLIALVIAFSGFGQKYDFDFVGERVMSAESTDIVSKGVASDSGSEVKVLPSEVQDEGTMSESQGSRIGSLEGAPNVWAWYLIGAFISLLVLIFWNMKKSERRSERDGE